MTVELVIREGNQEIWRQTLQSGSYQLGRISDNNLVVVSSHLSRHHLKLVVSEGSITVTDLGSTNGTVLRGRVLTPNTPIEWPVHESLQIGPLSLSQVQPQAEAVPTTPEAIPESDLVAHITCSEARPPRFTLAQGAATVGSGIRCDIRPLVGGLEVEHCRLTLQQSQVMVVNLSQNNPVKLAGLPLPYHQPTPWLSTQTLEVGYARLYYTLGQAVAQDAAALAPSTPGMGRWLMGLIGLGLALTFCIVAIAFIVLSQRDDNGPTSIVDGENGLSTPTLAPLVSATPSPVIFSTLFIDATTPETITPDQPTNDCVVATAATEGAGWLELPFPYQGTDPIFGGTAEQFRLISQRSRNGGRINSFFDHQYPVYPPAFGGKERDEVAGTMLIFDGSLSMDAFSQDETTSGSDARFDYYSGHAGIDFAPAHVADPRIPQTPVFAAADGFLYTATIDDDGNHMVWLTHDRGEEGTYATLYFHLADDAFFQAMVATPEGTEIPAGTRIGTMGTTGRSTGIHLHFEIRQDLDGNNDFSIYEKIDPYGYFPSEAYPVDPWSELWIDRTGQERTGAISQYLWLHPLVDVENEEDACLPQTEIKVDLYPVLDWSVVHPGFTYIARNPEGVPIVEGRPITREVTVQAEALVCGAPEDVRFQFIPYGSNTQSGQAIPTTFTRNEAGDFVFKARISGTGQYVLAGRNNRDCTPPTTSVLVDGEKVGENTYRGTIEITLRARERGTLRSPLQEIEIQYSLDCGRNWQIYQLNAPVQLSNDSPYSCGEAGVGQGIQLGPDDFLLLAIATDSMNNIEQPIKQFRFTILSNEP